MNIKSKKIYFNEDIDEFLLKARENKEAVLANLERVSSGQDAHVLRGAINNDDFMAEDFDRYDSDVCEQFLSLMVLMDIAE